MYARAIKLKCRGNTNEKENRKQFVIIAVLNWTKVVHKNSIGYPYP